MKLLMPSHIRRVKQYVDPTPVFQRYGVEDQLTAMYQPVVQLKSGGYLIIDEMEAAIDKLEDVSDVLEGIALKQA